MLAKTKLSVCDHCGNVFQNGDRVWTDNHGVYCSRECATYAQMARIEARSKLDAAFAPFSAKKANTTKNIATPKTKEAPKMDEIKLTINGKEVQLTDEQLWALGFKPDNTKRSPFARVQQGENYFIAGSRYADLAVEVDDETDNMFFKDANYFADENFAKQVALHQLLYRKLLKFAYDNEFEDEEWNGTNMHAYIIYNFTRKDYDIRWTRNEKEPGTVYFKTPTRATAALNEVVMPFVKEHPDFVW